LHLSEEWYRIYGFDPEEGLSAWEKGCSDASGGSSKWQETTIERSSEKSNYEGEHEFFFRTALSKHTPTVGHPV